MCVKIWEYAEMATWCLEGSILLGFKKRVYIQAPYRHAFCDIVPEALGTAALAASSSGKPQKAAALL